MSGANRLCSLPASDDPTGSINRGLFDDPQLLEHAVHIPVDPAFGDLPLFKPVDLYPGPADGFPRWRKAEIVTLLNRIKTPARRHELSFANLKEYLNFVLGERGVKSLDQGGPIREVNGFRATRHIGLLMVLVGVPEHFVRIAQIAG